MVTSFIQPFSTSHGMEGSDHIYVPTDLSTETESPSPIEKEVELNNVAKKKEICSSQELNPYHLVTILRDLFQFGGCQYATTAL